MGATNGYHPISLHVIRGAAEFCGFKIGKMRRVAQLPTEGKAVYSVEIEAAPRGWTNWSPAIYLRQLQHCFMDDIQVKRVEMATNRRARAVLVVQLGSTPMDAMLEAAGGSES